MKRVLVLLVLLLSASIAAAQPPPPPPGGPGYGPAPGPAPGPGMYGYTNPGVHTHEGFYLRMFLGAAFTSMKLEDADVEVSGPGGAFGIAVGFNVSPNLIIFGELFDDIAVDPTVEQGGSEVELNDVNAGVVGVGAGVAYYIQPSNIYVSGALTYTQLTVQSDGEEIGESEFGPGISLMVGKEWWVSDNWGVGVALQLFAGRMKDKGENAPTWETTAAALALSASYD